ncbi:Dephospho-CoA kinase [Microbacterium oxydans]|uniref:Dephospho-CoA kinase/protein folding accessory domain-containing protein n=1 Tax=Microbacterium oxydans TaxID=82380 RepID=A0A0F0L9V2_9MICO|nr:GrpB family protein [Microbacterium oxydans]KJL29977.1 dephospho-CoA kinase/protein folding accessory domain-containing protein [Microbacterium oxydans]CAH0235223.1 Dephospho-CoA kinase [Microbacterium oxydans]
MPRQLVSYDPTWPERFEVIAAELRAHGDPDWVIEHIGSTAVPGMRAKPIIDLAVRIEDAGDVDAHRGALEAIGWRVGSGVRSHPVMVFEEHGIRTRIAHFFTASAWEAVNQRILRDWLLAHPEDAERYTHAKCDAVAAAARGTSTYNAAKTPVIQDIVDRARQARGLPSVDVSDK